MSRHRNISILRLNVRSEVAAGFFQPSIDAVYNAVLEQMAMAQVHHKRISVRTRYCSTFTRLNNAQSVYVVGGFGASSLLFTALKSTLDKLDINVCRPDTHV